MRYSMSSLFCTKKRIWESNVNQMDLTGSINISTQQIHHLWWEVADSVCTKIIFFILCPDCGIDAPWKHVRNSFRLNTLMHIHWHRQTPPLGGISNDEKNDLLTPHPRHTTNLARACSTTTFTSTDMHNVALTAPPTFVYTLCVIHASRAPSSAVQCTIVHKRQ